MKRSALACALLVIVACVALVPAACKPYADLKAQVAVEWQKVKTASANIGGKSPMVEGSWTHVDTADGGAQADPFTGKCLLPTHQDEYSGFGIGLPTGWLLDYSTDTIIVAKDETQMEGALVFPARLRRSDIPAERLATQFAEGLGRSIARKGGTSQLTEQTTDGKVANAVILATIDGVELKGPLQVVERPGFVTLKLYWAPKDRFDTEEPTLKQVLTCFQRKTLITSKKPVVPAGGRVTRVGGKPSSTAASASASAPVEALKPYRGHFMNISMPAGWVVQDDKETGIDVNAGPKGEAAFGFGWFSNPQRNQDAVTILRGDITKFHPGVTILKSGQVPAPPGWVVVVAEYEGSGVHGVERVAEGRGIATMTMYFSSIAKWPTIRPTLEAMAASVEITPAAVAQVQADVRAQLASYPHPTPSTSTSSAGSGSSDLMSSWQKREDGQERSNQDFDDYIRGQERVTNAAGEVIIAPTSAWNDAGPKGPGYYQATPGGGAELLTPVPAQSETPATE